MTRAGRRGFTLIEVTVALALTGMVVTVAYAGLAVVLDAREHSERAHREELAATAAREQLVGWLRSTTLLFAARQRSDGAHPLDELVFAVSDGGWLRPGPHRIHLGTDLDPGTPARGLVAVLVPLGAPAPPETLSIAPRATGLELRYRIEEGGVRRWVRRWEEGGRMPDAVRLRLVASPRIRLGGESAGESAGELPAILRLPITVPIEARRW